MPSIRHWSAWSPEVRWSSAGTLPLVVAARSPGRAWLIGSADTPPLWRHALRRSGRSGWTLRPIRSGVVSGLVWVTPFRRGRVGGLPFSDLRWVSRLARTDGVG